MFYFLKLAFPLYIWIINAISDQAVVCCQDPLHFEVKEITEAAI